METDEAFLLHLKFEMGNSGQELLGHKSSKTREIYTHVSQRDSGI
jgi:site-specific recombinase XerD